MKLWLPVQVGKAFPFQQLGHHVDDIGGHSYQSLVEDVVPSKIEAETAVHRESKISYAHLDPWQLDQTSSLGIKLPQAQHIDLSDAVDISSSYLLMQERICEEEIS